MNTTLARAINLSGCKKWSVLDGFGQALRYFRVRGRYYGDGLGAAWQWELLL